MTNADLLKPYQVTREKYKQRKRMLGDREKDTMARLAKFEQKLKGGGARGGGKEVEADAVDKVGGLFASVCFFAQGAGRGDWDKEAAAAADHKVGILRVGESVGLALLSNAPRKTWFLNTVNWSTVGMRLAFEGQEVCMQGKSGQSNQPNSQPTCLPINERTHLDRLE